jgi:hypothetical protein
MVEMFFQKLEISFHSILLCYCESAKILGDKGLCLSRVGG